MKGQELQALRKRLGLSTADMARALGYEGQDSSLGAMMRRFESGGRPMPPTVARLATMFERYGLPDDLRTG